jgi:hypothetical protein
MRPLNCTGAFQVTRNKSKHPIKVSGLRDIQRWLRDVGPKSLLPTKQAPWCFVFILPPNMESAFKYQKLKDDTKTREWAGKMNQFVLGLNVGDVYND